MNYIKEKTKDLYLMDTKVENIFINEYMPQAPGDYVKVYVYALMYAEHMFPMKNETMALQLNVSESKIKEAWNYWEKLGVIKKHYLNDGDPGDFTVEFRNLKNLLYGDISEEETQPQEEVKANPMGNSALKQLISSIEGVMNRSLATSEVKTIIDWNEADNISPEIINYCVNYCVEKNKYSFKYIDTVLRNWKAKGLDTVDKVNSYLGDMDEKYFRYKRVLKALGFNRSATEEEKNIMDRWFDELDYDMDKVLEACSKTAGIPNPNFRYVDKVLLNWSEEAKEEGRSVNAKKPVSRAVLNRYLDYLREKEEKEAEERKQEIYRTLPQVKHIDEEMARIGSELSRALISRTLSQDERRRMEKEMEELTIDRALTLTENNYDMNYTDVKYTCDKCKDTGITEEGQCDCIQDRMEEAEIWQRKNGFNE